MTTSRTFTEKQLADRDSLMRGSGSRAAWMDVMCRFSRTQREYLANMLAHSWTISAIEIQSVLSRPSEVGERVVADKSCKDVFPNGPNRPAVLDEEDTSATLASLSAEVCRLQLDAKLTADEVKATATYLREALDAVKLAGPEGLPAFLEEVEIYAARPANSQ